MGSPSTEGQPAHDPDKDQCDSPQSPPPATSRYTRLAVAGLLSIHAVLVAVLGWQNAPNLDESAHLPAGLSHWEFGNFTLYRVNPPLIRMWAALPLLVTAPETDWSAFTDDAYSRAEFTVGAAFHNANGERTFGQFTLARWVLIPVSLIGGWVCWKWSSELYGTHAGLLALVLWCFCPNLLTWAASITPDMGSAAFGVLASWRFWKWLKQPSWSNAILAGTTLGLVQLTKSTWIILFGLWPLMWCLWCWIGRKRQRPAPALAQLLLIPCLAVYLLNLGYGFEGSGQPLKQFRFISHTLGGPDAHEGSGNRFENTWLGEVRVPVPANYVRGIDIQKYDFEVGKWSWLRGRQQKGGWWYYYGYALLVKSPAGFLGLIGIATAVWLVRPAARSSLSDELLLMIPGLAVFLLVSSQTGFNRYLRYILPAMPFLYIHAARVAVHWPQQSAFVRSCMGACLIAGVTSSLAVFPYSMSYFNFLSGGPSNGQQHLLDGNIDWGQDLLRLRDWMQDHPEARPIQVALTTFVPLEATGIPGDPISAATDKSERPAPGWYAIGINQLMGYKLFGSSRPECVRFQDYTPVAKVGYSTYIYHVE